MKNKPWNDFPGKNYNSNENGDFLIDIINDNNKLLIISLYKNNKYLWKRKNI